MLRIPAVLFPIVASCFAGAAVAQGDVVPQGAHAEWLQDFAAAKQQAKAESKDLLVDFTGSDWCVWCQRLDKEVFEEADFQSAIGKDFVLVKLDFPQNKSLITEEIRAQNEQLQQDYAVRGFPTIFLLDDSGRPYAQTGYQQGGAAAYLAHLAELRKVKATRDEHFAMAAKAEGVDRAKHLAAGLEPIDGEVVLAHYRPTVDEIIALDADNAAGLKEHWELMVARSDFEKRFQESAQGGDWDAVAQMVEQGLKQFAGKPDLQQQLTFYRVVLALERDHDFAAALKLIDEAMAFAPDSELGQKLVRIKKNLEKMRAQEQEQAGKGDGGK